MFRLAPLAALALAACASPGIVAPSAPVPATLQPADEKAAFSWHARGVQIYECQASDTAPAAWTFVAPEAELFADAASKAVLGSHGAGPFWKGNDGSQVTGKVKQRADAPQPGAIPWLLLTTTPAPAGGRLAPVKSVQRINTVGGIAPASGCASKADAGARARVPYTADYVFFVVG